MAFDLNKLAFETSTGFSSVSGIEWNDTGDKAFVITGRDTIEEYSLTNDYDISNVSFNDSLILSNAGGSSTIDARGVAFDDTGQKFFVCDNDAQVVESYTTSNSYDISDTLQFDRLDISDQVSGASGLAFNAGGTRLYVIGVEDTQIHQYSLSTGFDLSTASFDKSETLDNIGVDGATGLDVKPDGSRWYAYKEGSKEVLSYSSDLIDDIGGLTQEDTFDASANVDTFNDAIGDINFGNNGDRLVIVDGSTGFQFRENEAPTADFSFTPSVPTPNETVNFDGGASTDPEGDDLSFDWDFDDGNFGFGNPESNTFTSAGTFTVSLEVTDALGATDTTTEEVKVNGPPTADFTISDDTLIEGESTTFDATPSSDPNNETLNYDWDLGNGNTATGETVTETYNNDGENITITLTVTDQEGETDTATGTIDVSSPINADFTISDPTPNSGKELTFDGGSTTGGDGDPKTFLWNFDDGSTGSGKVITHTFDFGGTYGVELDASEIGGDTDTKTKVVTVDFRIMLSTNNGALNSTNGVLDTV